jgi:hypothetical protein
MIGVMDEAVIGAKYRLNGSILISVVSGAAGLPQPSWFSDSHFAPDLDPARRLPVDLQPRLPHPLGGLQNLQIAEARR